MRRTKKALYDSFSALVLDRHYDRIQVSDIIARAEVGRSTFYEHYDGKDDLLLQSMAGLLDILADAAAPAPAGDGDAAVRERLERLLAHFNENRSLTRYLLSGPPSQHVGPRLRRDLAARIGGRLETLRARRRGEPLIPLPMIADLIAAAQLGLLRAWLEADAPCPAARLAEGMRRGCAGAIEALLPIAG